MSDFSIIQAVDAAEQVARRLGLGGVEASPLSVSDHVALFLPSAPAVARIKPAAAEAEMRREIDLVAYLYDKGAPVVPPLTGPYVEQAFVMSFWRWVPHRLADPDHADHRRLAVEALRHVHHASSGYPLPLPSLEEKVEACRALLRSAPLPTLSNADRLFLLEVGEEFRGQTEGECRLHGDAGFHNLFITSTGALWNDFTSACRGPRGWDEAALGIDHSLSRLRSFCVSVWCWNLADDPAKRAAADYHLNLLKGI